MASIICKNVSKKLGNKVVWKDLDLTIGEGKIIGLAGPSGSGKTTLLKLIAKFLTPDSGTITVCGEQKEDKIKSIVSFMPDKLQFDNNIKVSGIVNFYGSHYKDFNKEKCLKYLTAFNISAETTMGAFSRGNIETIQLILTMSRNAKVYLLDEPLAFTDPIMREHIIKTILKEYRDDATILMSTHLLTDVEAALDDVIIIGENKIICQKSVDEIRESTGKSLLNFYKDCFKEGGQK